MLWALHGGPTRKGVPLGGPRPLGLAHGARGHAGLGDPTGQPTGCRYLWIAVWLLWGSWRGWPVFTHIPFSEFPDLAGKGV